MNAISKEKFGSRRSGKPTAAESSSSTLGGKAVGVSSRPGLPASGDRKAIAAYLKAYGDQTDYARLDAATDDEVRAAALSDPDTFIPDEAWFAEAKLVLPPTKRQLTLRLDAEIIAHFRSAGPRWQTRINAVLKRYVQAQKAK